MGLSSGGLSRSTSGRNRVTCPANKISLTTGKVGPFDGAILLYSDQKAPRTVRGCLLRHMCPKTSVRNISRAESTRKLCVVARALPQPAACSKQSFPRQEKRVELLFCALEGVILGSAGCVLRRASGAWFSSHWQRLRRTLRQACQVGAPTAPRSPLCALRKALQASVIKLCAKSPAPPCG